MLIRFLHTVTTLSGPDADSWPFFLASLLLRLFAEGKEKSKKCVGRSFDPRNRGLLWWEVRFGDVSL